MARRRTIGHQRKVHVKLNQSIESPSLSNHAELLESIGVALRHGGLDEVEAAVAHFAYDDAVGLNLRGLIHEAHGDQRLARLFYGRAMRADRHFVPAQQNMQRLYELMTVGRTELAPAIGEALTDLWFDRVVRHTPLDAHEARRPVTGYSLRALSRRWPA
jgi:hypothetical protein